MKCINSPKKHNAKSSKASCWVVVERKLIKFLASGINSTPFYITLTCAWKGNQLKKKQITTATEIKKIFIIIFVFQVQSLLWVVFMTMTKWPVGTVIDIIYLYRGFFSSLPSPHFVSCFRNELLSSLHNKQLLTLMNDRMTRWEVKKNYFKTLWEVKLLKNVFHNVLYEIKMEHTTYGGLWYININVGLWLAHNFFIKKFSRNFWWIFTFSTWNLFYSIKIMQFSA